MITDWSILSSRDDTQPVLSNDSWLPQRSRRITHLKEQVYNVMMSSVDWLYCAHTDGPVQDQSESRSRAARVSVVFRVNLVLEGAVGGLIM